MIRALGEYVLIEPQERKKTVGAAGVIVAPDMVQDVKIRVGKVLSIGHTVNVPHSEILKVGDRVLLSSHEVPEKIPGSQNVLARAGSLLAVLPGPLADADVAPDQLGQDEHAKAMAAFARAQG